MAVEAKITLNKQQYVQELEQVKNKTKQATGNIQESARKTGEDFSRVGGAASAMGSVVGQQFGAVGQAISALAAGPIGILLAAITAVITAATWLWDKLTVSAEEAAAKADLYTKSLEKQAAIADRQSAQTEKMLKRLQELNNQEQLSNAQRKESERILRVLSGRYGDLGAQIDSVSGKIKNLDQVEAEANKRKLQQQIEIRKLQLEDAKQRTYNAFAAYTEEIGMSRQARSQDMGMIDVWLGKNDARGGGTAVARAMVERSRGLAEDDAIEAANKTIDAAYRVTELEMQLDELLENMRVLETPTETKGTAKTEKTAFSAGSQTEEAAMFTNSLTQRGGFATGAKVESLNDINRRIADASARSSKVLQEINAKMDNLDKVRL